MDYLRPHRNQISISTLFALLFLLLLTGLPGSAGAAGLTPFRVASTNTTGQTGSITLNRPTGTLSGDVMLAAVTLLSPSGSVSFTLPAGWTQVRLDAQSGEIAQGVFFKVAGGSEPASYTFSHNQTVEASGAIASYWNIDTTNPIDIHGGQYNAGSTPTAPSITTTLPGTTLVAIFGTKNGTQLSAPTNMVERWYANGTNGQQGFDELFTGSGATGSRTATSSAGSTVGQLIALTPAAPTASGTILFPTRNSGSFTAAELVRTDFLETMGYTIQPIYSNASAAEIATASALADVVYISEEVPSNNVRNDYTLSCLGVVLEEEALPDDFLLATSTSNYTAVNAAILTTGHAITQPFPLGNLQLFTSVRSGQLHYLNGIASGGVHLASRPGATSDVALAAFDIGATLTDSSGAAGRRVFLPWGTSTMTEVDILRLTANGQQLLSRSLDWAKGANACSRMSKRAFLTDGTPLASGAQVAAGTEIKFLIYISNSGPQQSNVSIQDILDPAFTYQSGSLQIDNSLANCASTPCSSAEEAAIFAAAAAAPVLSESVDGDGVRYDGPSTTIDAGAGVDINNGTVNVAAGSVWALLFSVTVN